MSKAELRAGDEQPFHNLVREGLPTNRPDTTIPS
jgi:hypothetical protein